MADKEENKSKTKLEDEKKPITTKTNHQCFNDIPEGENTKDDISAPKKPKSNASESESLKPTGTKKTSSKPTRGKKKSSSDE